MEERHLTKYDLRRIMRVARVPSIRESASILLDEMRVIEADGGAAICVRREDGKVKVFVRKNVQV